ncbi:BAG domain-containing protein [Cephalotus follicularis]|uniref:BAG domain-containing protein n=1 Tax=Cephalotus follicularis TaxID=3775 RepID=A0A1Q3BCL9_CEPFO|nr:BAG domain-containing protein [Cephalotus follicularis]
MASHHRHHHQQQLNPLPTTSCCCSWHCCTQSYHPSPPPPPPQTEPLLQALVSHLLLQQQPPPQNLQKGQHFKQQKKNFHQTQEDLHYHHNPQSQSILSSLLHRIDALESSLQRFSSSAKNHYLSYSLRDTAARVIQTHFRAFLVRRSITLGLLKDLAFIKSRFNSLKLSVSNKAHFDFEVVSHKAMALLIKLDSIQGGDPMIRDGKRSITRDLVKFLEFIDGFAVKRHQISYKAAKNVRFVSNSNKSRVLRSSDCENLRKARREVMEELSDRVEKISGFSRVLENDEENIELERFHQVIDDDDEQPNPRETFNEKSGASNIRSGILVKRHGGQARVKKNVRFADNGNVIWLVSSGGVSLIGGTDSSEDQGVVEKHRNEVDGIEGDSNESEDDEEAHLENGRSSHSSDEEKIPKGCFRSGARADVCGDMQARVKKSVRFADNGNVQARVKKSVRFADNGNVIWPVSSGGVSLIDGTDYSEDRGVVENHCNEVEGIDGDSTESEDDEEAHLEKGRSSHSSDEEKIPRGSFRSGARADVSGDIQGQNKTFMFSAPAPVKMESKADLMKKRRALKIVT